MQSGDLVKRKWTTFAEKRRAHRMNKGSQELGIVIECPSSLNSCKVMFPSSGEIRIFMKEHLEIIQFECDNNEDLLWKYWGDQ